MSMVKPRASTVGFQSMLFFGSRIGVSPFSPGPNNITFSDAREAEAIRAVWSDALRCTLAVMKSSTYTDVKNGSFGPPLRWAFTLTPVGICVGLPVSHGFTILTCDIIAFPSGRITALSTVVLQWACPTAAAIRPQYPGDAAHPQVSLKSDTTTSSTT